MFLKKGCRSFQENYLPVSILPVLSKLFKEIFFYKKDRLWMSTCKKISVALARVWPQHCLLLMPEEWKISVDKEKVFGTFLANFQNTFDPINHKNR